MIVMEQKTPQIEAWMRGPIADVPALLHPVLYGFQMAREDLAAHVLDLTEAQLWARPDDLTPVGFQVRHIAGSVDRLLTYTMGRQLDDAQMIALKSESEPGASKQELMSAIDQTFAKAEGYIRQIDVATLTEPRYVGRKQLPTTVLGLLVHIAEHTQRHIGEAIMVARLARRERLDASLR
jgi:hypothetical protein